MELYSVAEKKRSIRTFLCNLCMICIAWLFTEWKCQVVDTIYGKTFKRENICSFRDYTASHECFPLEYFGCKSLKIFQYHRVKICTIKNMGMAPVSLSLIGG